MKLVKSILAVLTLTVFCCMSAPPALAKDDTVKIRNASRLIGEISNVPRWKIPPGVLKTASAVVIVPMSVKRDFMVSGGSAGGFLLVQDKVGTWSNPVFVTMTGGTLGWQVVTDPLDIILVIRSSKRVDELTRGKLKLDAKVAVQPGWLGLSMKSASASQAKAEIVSYVRSRGKLVEDSTAAGVTVQIDNAANAFFYGNPKVEPNDILSGKVTRSSDEVKTLHKLLSDYAAGK